MITKLHHWWKNMQSSFWFVPAVIVLGAVGLATALIAVDTTADLQVVTRWPLLFGAGAAGARGLLTAVASSMITVAGVVFSITIVALALTSSQYTSRVLRNFMRDRVNQMVLGVFLGIFAYCLVVLRVIRSGDEEGAFVPSLAVLGGLILAFVGIAYLVYFIHYISLSIQASRIIATAARETIAAVDRLFPQGLGVDGEADASGTLMSLEETAWSTVTAQKTGYIERVDGDALLVFAREHGTVLRMERGIGEFIVEGTPLISVAQSGGLDEDTRDELNEVYAISRHRTVEQDAGFGIRQIVDVALKALSPGINDTTTAVMCVDYLAAILVRLAPRSIPTARRLDRGELRVIARGPSFASLFAEAFDQIRQNAAGNVAILTHLLRALEIIADATANQRRRQLLRQQADLITALGERTIPSLHDREDMRAAMARLAQVLAAEQRSKP